MRKEQFSARAPGRLVPTIYGAMAFVPDPAPRSLQLDNPTIGLLVLAEHRLGTLGGAAGRLLNPYVVIAPLLRQEAIASSRIEGTIATPEQLALFEAGVDPTAQSSDTREVWNFVTATEHAVDRLGAGEPIASRLLLDTHRLLMVDVRGNQERPGEFRSDQNFIGTSRDILAARFVPPPHLELPKLISDLEHLVNDEGRELPRLVRAAIAHYQFETIHPFRDGNGRIGRLLVLLLMIRDGAIPSPLLPLSPAFERQRAEYADLLLRVSTDNDWLPWIRFFLQGIVDSAEAALHQVTALTDLREQWHGRFQAARSSALLLKLIDRLFVHPAITIGQTAELLQVTPASASSNIAKLQAEGILTEVTGRTRDRIYVARDVLRFTAS